MTQLFSYLLIVDAYFNIPKLYGMEKITTEEVMDKLDMFQSRFGKIDQFGWWSLERISSDEGTQLPRRITKKNAKLTNFVWHYRHLDIKR